MKFFYLAVCGISTVVILILYFQLLIVGGISVPVFSVYMPLTIQNMVIVLLGYIGGATLVLAIKGFTSSSSDLGDDFDL